MSVVQTYESLKNNLGLKLEFTWYSSMSCELGFDKHVSIQSFTEMLLSQRYKQNLLGATGMNSSSCSKNRQSAIIIVFPSDGVQTVIANDFLALAETYVMISFNYSSKNNFR